MDEFLSDGFSPSGSFVPDASRRSAFPPIAEYAFLSDREVTALVAPSGSVEWLCLPRPDSPSVFAAILDRTAGHFRVGPVEQTVPAGRRYLPGTNVLETTWQTRTGWLIVRDSLLVGPWYEDEHRDEAYQRPPDDHQAEHCLLRQIRCVNGQVDVGVHLEPVFDYARENASWEYTGTGYGEATARGGQHDPVLHVTTDLRLGLEGRAATVQTRMREGDDAFIGVRWGGDGHPGPSSAEEAEEQMQQTSDFWREWLNQGDFPDHPWRAYLQRSALVLKGLQYAPTGALLAAATTSLPETPGGQRNWDYRYSWVRDSTFALWGLYTLGFDREARAFFSFVGDRITDGEHLQVMYGVGGEKELAEQTLDHLTGYEGSTPVRIGNAAWNQRQHDLWGALVDSVYLNLKAGEYVSPDFWADVETQVERAIESWREPDHGIWEVRGTPRHFTSSKIMCWVALDRGARLAGALGMPQLASRWQAVADEIRADVLEHAVDDRKVLTQHYDTDALDASALLAVLLRFLPTDDPIARATVLAIADELTVDGMVLRYKVEQTDDGLSGEEGTFAICSFWLASALVEIGELEQGRALCEKLLSYASPLGLYAEEIDVLSGRHLGNYPQAFTHLALINAVMHVVRAEQDTGVFSGPLRAVG